jgi:ankyrin repeat protein
MKFLKIPISLVSLLLFSTVAFSTIPDATDSYMPSELTVPFTPEKTIHYKGTIKYEVTGKSLEIEATVYPDSKWIEVYTATDDNMRIIPDIVFAGKKTVDPKTNEPYYKGNSINSDIGMYGNITLFKSNPNGEFYLENLNGEAVAKGCWKIFHPALYFGTPLFTATKRNFFDKVVSLVSNGANLNIVNHHRRTALVWPAYSGYVKTVDYLLKNGADPNIADIENKTPLYLAACNGHIDVVSLLLTHGADPDIASTQMETPLSCASKNGHTEIVKLLLEHDADPDIPNLRKETPLLLAASNGHKKIVEILLVNNADPDIADAQGDKPIFWAKEFGYTEIVTMLEAAM